MNSATGARMPKSSVARSDNERESDVDKDRVILRVDGSR